MGRGSSLIVAGAGQPAPRIEGGDGFPNSALPVGEDDYWHGAAQYEVATISTGERGFIERVLGSCNRGVSAKALRYLLGCPRLLVAYCQYAPESAPGVRETA
jgi:hypothetical protein